MSRDEYKENRIDNAHATRLNSGMCKRWLLLEVKVLWLPGYFFLDLCSFNRFLILLRNSAEIPRYEATSF